MFLKNGRLSESKLQVRTIEIILNINNQTYDFSGIMGYLI
jgi:hypothetical protein